VKAFFLYYINPVIFAFIVYLSFNFGTMGSKKFSLYILLFPLLVLGQNNQLWQGYFSYNRITDIATTTNTIYASSENAYFTKGLTSNDITTINSIDGLKADEITAIFHSEVKNITFVGNRNGLLFLIKNDGTILQKRGIIDEVPVSPLLKKINHFLENNDKLYLSCDYGISVFDLNTNEFGNTYYMGPQGSYVAVQQTAINNGFIYAATKGNAFGSGIRKANLSSPFLDDFTQWVDISGNEWNGVISFGTNIYAITNAVSLLKYDGLTPTYLLNFPEVLLDLRTNGNYFTITSANHVYVFNQAIQQIVHIQSNQITGDPVTFFCATVLDDVIYIGTNERGMLSSTISNPTNFTEIKPNGPERNYIFRVKKSTSALWALYGKYNRTYNPYNLEPPFDGPFKFPISKFTPENGWDFIPYADLFGAKALSNIAFNPNNDNDFYVSSYFSGLLKVVNETPTVLFDNTNTGSDGLQLTSVADGIRVNGPAYDRNSNLWMTNNFSPKALKVLRANGSWQSFDLGAIIPETNVENYAILVVDKNGTKWLPSSRNGLIAFNDQLNNKSIVIKTQTEGNLPDTDVRCVAIDNRNQLWIGTAKGLRIISTVDQFLTEDEIQTRPIIIEEEIDGEVLAQELFFDQFILDIAIDGANRKWVSIADSGVFLVSPNGQQTIYRFTKENSPLPSNNVLDIEVDGITGEVFFATDKGMVSFKGTATKPQDDLSNVYVYPNPVRPEFVGTVKISGLTDKANVKIADIEGNLVYETTSSGGTIEWDTTAFGKYRVASGVYMIFIATQEGTDTTVKKVMIIR
jgi:ligand-binding sensor domain-containing protein